MSCHIVLYEDPSGLKVKSKVKQAFDCSEEFLYIFKETKEGVWEWFYVDEYKDKKTPIPLYEDAIRDKISILKRILDMKKENQSI